eukprot:scaffold243629_cov22-Tisochrysis_lutea.AAC.1
MRDCSGWLAGPGDAVFEVHSKEPARCSTSPLRLDLLQPKPEWGAWRQRATAIPGIPIMVVVCFEVQDSGAHGGSKQQHPTASRHGIVSEKPKPEWGE